MALSAEEMAQIKHEQLGGFRAAVAWNDALNALHAFAQQSGCPAGYEVGRWFKERSEAYQAALSAAIREANAPAEARSEQAEGGAERCQVCGYTEEDKRTLLDHHLCPTERGQ